MLFKFQKSYVNDGTVYCSINQIEYSQYASLKEIKTSYSWNTVDRFS